VAFSTETLQNLLDTWGYLAVTVFVAIESSGIPFPGETMLIVAGVYAGAGHLSIQLVIVAAAIGAILGDNAGYLLGRTGGRALVVKYGHYVRIDQKKLDTAEEFFRRHGDKTVFFGRFVAVLRAWAAFLAGVNHMPWPRFLVFNAAGGIVWATVYGTLAYMLGKNLPLLEKVVRAIGIGGVVAAVLVIGGLIAWHFRERWMWWRKRDAEEKVEGDKARDDVAVK
jgi:membrane protein DedA with SNARE-associated domain